jgi:hypothetical protein
MGPLVKCTDDYPSAAEERRVGKDRLRRGGVTKEGAFRPSPHSRRGAYDGVVPRREHGTWNTGVYAFESLGRRDAAVSGKPEFHLSIGADLNGQRSVVHFLSRASGQTLIFRRRIRLVGWASRISAASA